MNESDLIKNGQELWQEGKVLEAERLLLQAAENGSGHAAHELGVLYRLGGPGLLPNQKEGNRWLEKSLESGFEETIVSDPLWFRRMGASDKQG